MNLPLVYKPEYSSSWAMVIGINAYSHCSPLSYAKQDAQAVQEALQTRFGFPKENIKTLLDGAATKKAITNSFLNYAHDSRVKPDDRILLFFAGHGFTKTGLRGEVGFLVPVNGNVENLSSLIRWDELTRNADLIVAKHILFIMDACYGGLAFVRQPSFGSMRFLKDMLQRPTRQVLTAGKADETVADGNGVRPGHSIFTAHLLNAFEGGAATTDGIISATGIMAYVYERVSRDQYSLQTPHYGFIDGDGDFIFDTSPFKKLSESPEAIKSEKGEIEKDILVNTSPELASIGVSESPVVAKTKEYLSDPTKRIRLNDFSLSHARVFLESSDLRHFPVDTSPFSKQEFISRVQRYEDLSKDLQSILTLLAHWADPDQLPVLQKLFTRIAEADKGAAGMNVWLSLSWYPVLYLMYSAGIAALAQDRYHALKIILETPIQDDLRSAHFRALVIPVGSKLSQIHDQFKLLPGRERNYVPRSEHLFTTVQPALEDLLFLGRSYEMLFDRFEIVFGLSYAHHSNRSWGPPGRFAWKHNEPVNGRGPFMDLWEEAGKKGDNWAPLKAGFFNGSYKRFVEIAESYKVQMEKLGWG